VYDFDQLFRPSGASRASFARRIDHVRAHVARNDFGRETVHRASRRNDQVKDLAASFFLFERSLYRLDLPAHATHPGEQPALFLDRVPHAGYLLLRKTWKKKGKKENTLGGMVSRTARDVESGGLVRLALNSCPGFDSAAGAGFCGSMKQVPCALLLPAPAALLAH
jgi:hypothetical protein